MLSGYQEFGKVKKAMNLSVVDYLVKPVDKVEIGQFIKKIARQLQERWSKSDPQSKNWMRQDLRTTCQVRTATVGLSGKSRVLLPFLTVFGARLADFHL